MRNITFILFLFFTTQGAFATGLTIEPNPLVPKKSKILNEKSTAPTVLNLQKGKSFGISGASLNIKTLKGNDGTGTFYLPALNYDFEVQFENLLLLSDGQILDGTIQAIQKSEATNFQEKKGLFRFFKKKRTQEGHASTLPQSITAKLKELKDYNLPRFADLILLDLEVTSEGTFVDLEFEAPSIMEDDFLYFKGERVKIENDDFCLDNVNLDLTVGGGIDDFEFPLRIIKGDPNVEGKGSYATFSCEGLKNFNLQAQYPFPKEQLVPADQSSGVDTVMANFIISSPTLGSFMSFASVTPFSIPGVDDMIFTIDSAYVDYSDASNPANFFYQDPDTGEEVDEKWKGVFFRKISISLPPSITSFNGGKELLVGGENIVYDRGNGISAEIFAYNLLELGDGSLDGWGLSIDTLNVNVKYNSLENLDLGGNVYIPITGEGENINYNCLIGKDENGQSTVVFAMDVQGEYTLPMLGDLKMSLDNSSKAGVRYNSGGGFEPYANFSGALQIVLGGGNSGIPEIAIPDITFQDFKLNDLEMAATAAAGEVTGGLDRMSIGTFGFGGIDGGDIPEIPSRGGAGSGASGGGEKKVNGMPINIKNFDFTSVKEGGKPKKKLEATLELNLLKGTKSISGALTLGIIGEVEYSKLISKTPWDALTYDKVEVGEIMVDAKFSTVHVKGALAVFDQHATYGKGFKGGIDITLELAKSQIKAKAVGQFGVTNYNHNEDYRYFFFDLQVEKNPGFPMGSVELRGIGGGFYFNMDKSYKQLNEEDYGNAMPALNATPGQSFTGADYTPKQGKFGFSASVILAMTPTAELLNGDAELTVQMDYNDLSIEKIMFSGRVNIMSPSWKKRDESAIIAQMNITLNIEKKVLNADYRFDVKAPSGPVPLVVGEGSGALQIDLDNEDENDFDSYMFFGKPKDPIKVDLVFHKLKFGGLEAYFMSGADIPDMIPLAEKSKVFESMSEVPSSDRGNSTAGVAFGFFREFGTEIKAGPIKASFQVAYGLDASFKKYPDARCDNVPLGLNGWYLKGRAYAGLEGAVSVEAKIFKKTFSLTLMQMNAAVKLYAELPNPTYVEGEAYVKGSVLNGKIKVDKHIKIKIGQRCEIEIDPSALVADIKIVSGIHPSEDKDKQAFKVYDAPIIAFDRKVSWSGDVPSEIMEVEAGDVTYQFFPFVHEHKFTGPDGKDISAIKSLNNSLILSPKSLLKPLSQHKLKLVIRWRQREWNNSQTGGWKDWKDVKRRDGSYFEEVVDETFKTGKNPEKMQTAFLDPSLHFPFRNQRYWHRNFAKGEIHFSKPGFEYMFNKRKRKTIDNITKDVDYNYVIRLTDMETGELKTIPINEKPGDHSYWAWEKERRGNVTVNVLVNKKSKAIKYNQLNDEGVLEKERLYKMQIAGMPVIQEVPAQVTVNQVNQSNSSGIEVSSVSAQIVSNANPFTEPDILYEYYFATSKFNSLKEKLQSMKFAERKKDDPVRGFGLKALENNGHDRINWHRGNQLDNISLWQLIYKMYYTDGDGADRDIKNDFLVWDLEEPFDASDYHRLRRNLNLKVDLENLEEHQNFGQDYKKLTQDGIRGASLTKGFFKKVDGGILSDSKTWMEMTNQGNAGWIRKEEIEAGALKKAEELGGDFTKFKVLYKRRSIVNGQYHLAFAISHSLLTNAGTVKGNLIGHYAKFTTRLGFLSGFYTFGGLGALRGLSRINLQYQWVGHSQRGSIPQSNTKFWGRGIPGTNYWSPDFPYLTASNFWYGKRINGIYLPFNWDANTMTAAGNLFKQGYYERGIYAAEKNGQKRSLLTRYSDIYEMYAPEKINFELEFKYKDNWEQLHEDGNQVLNLTFAGIDWKDKNVSPVSGGGSLDNSQARAPIAEVEWRPKSEGTENMVKAPHGGRGYCRVIKNNQYHLGAELRSQCYLGEGNKSYSDYEVLINTNNGKVQWMPDDGFGLPDNTVEFSKSQGSYIGLAQKYVPGVNYWRGTGYSIKSISMDQKTIQNFTPGQTTIDFLIAKMKKKESSNEPVAEVAWVPKEYASKYKPVEPSKDCEVCRLLNNGYYRYGNAKDGICYYGDRKDSKYDVLVKVGDANVRWERVIGDETPNNIIKTNTNKWLGRALGAYSGILSLTNSGFSRTYYSLPAKREGFKFDYATPEVLIAKLVTLPPEPDAEVAWASKENASKYESVKPSKDCEVCRLNNGGYRYGIAKDGICYSSSWKDSKYEILVKIGDADVRWERVRVGNLPDNIIKTNTNNWLGRGLGAYSGILSLYNGGLMTFYALPGKTEGYKIDKTTPEVLVAKLVNLPPE